MQKFALLDLDKMTFPAKPTSFFFRGGSQYPSLISHDFLSVLKDWLLKGLIATINRNLKLGA